MMVTTIGIDPHKATHTAVAIDEDPRPCWVRSPSGGPVSDQDADGLGRARLTGDGARVWAVESAGGLGLPVVPTARRRAASTSWTCRRCWRLGSGCSLSGKSDKNDPNDARSVAIAAFRQPGLAVVQREDHAASAADAGETASRAHLAAHPGGVPAPRNTDAAETRWDAATAVRQGRQPDAPGDAQPGCGRGAATRVARAHLGDIRRLDRDIKANKTLIRAKQSAASETTVTDLYGVGPIVAAFLIGYTGDPARFATSDRYAAYNGTAPIEVSSGGKKRHRLSLRGNRRLNHAIHMAAVTQIRFDTPGRVYYDKKLAEGKTKKEALRALKRRISDAVYRQLVADQQRTQTS